MSLGLYDCVLWNKLENASLISEIGPNGTWAGTPTHPACKFGNGAYTNAQANYITFPGAFFKAIADSFIIDIWFKSDWACVNGLSQLGTTQWWFGWFDTNSNRLGLYSELSTGPNGTRFFSTRNGISIYQDCNTINWAAHTLHNILLAQDINGILGSANTYRLYLDGSLMATDNQALNSMAGGDGTFYVLSYSGTTGIFLGTQDNIKIYPVTYLNEILRQRYHECFGRPKIIIS